MNRRIIGVIAAVVLAGVGAFVIVSYVRGVEARALAGERVTEVFVVNEAIAAGTPGENLAANVSATMVPAKVRPSDSVEDLSELAGLVAAVDLVPGEQLLRPRFLDPQEFAALGAVEVPEGMHQVSVELDAQRALGGNLTPGDTVGVIASFTNVDSTEDGETASSETTHLVLHKVLVTRLEGAQSSTEDDGSASNRVGGRVMVTLAVDAAAAERVVFAAEHGTVWLTHEPAEAPEGGTRIQTKETIYR
jgi:pilus assembly protein CpaB